MARRAGLLGGLPQRCAGMPPRQGRAAFSPPVKNELLFTCFSSFRREKLSVARLQREVAQSRSEGAMVSCGNSLFAILILLLQDLDAVCLAEDGHQSIKTLLDIMMGCQWCIDVLINLRKSKALSWLPWKSCSRGKPFPFPCWWSLLELEARQAQKAVLDQNAVGLLAC